MVKTNPTDYSGINNSGEWTITKHLIPKYVSNWSAVVEGYNLSSVEKYIDPVVYDNKLKPGKNAILDRADFYTMHNWDKTKFNQFNTESQTYLPMNLVHASSLSQVNAEILDNTEKVDVVGTSSTIRIHFSRRPGGIQQIEYLIPSVNTSAFTLGRAGGDTGMALNLNQRFWEFDYIRPECSSAETAKFFGAPSSTGQQSNPTRGGSRYNPSGSGLWGENGWYVADQGWPPSPTTYRNYVTGVVPNTNIVSAAFKSCVIPFDFVSNKGEVESTSNQYKGVDEQYQYYALWKNQRWYEDITVNYEGIEGATHHVNWMYFPKVKDNVPYGKTLFDDNLGPALNNYFDKAYMYFPISGRNYELVDLDDKGLSGGIDYNYLLTHGWPELTGTDTSWSHYLSGTVSGFYKNTTFTYINENTYNPIVAKYPAGTFQSLLTNTLTESDWNSFIDRIRPDLNNSRIDNITVESVRPRTYFRPLDSLFDYDRTNNYYYNQWGDKGTLFFDWPKFKTALNYYYQGKTQNRQDLITSAQSIADDCYYFCMILEKTAGNFATTGIEAGKPFITSGPYAVGILAKGDTDLNHYHIFNSTGVIYSGNHCSGDFNQFTFIQQRYRLGFLYDRGWLTASSNGSPEIWYGLQGNLFNMHAYSYTGKAKGWVGNQYWLVYGKNALEVKSKIDRIIASGGPKRRPSISNIPKVILDNAPPLQ